MKKTYINPKMVVVRIMTAKMIASSQTLGFGNDVSTAAGAEARDFDFDFDDEE